LDEEAGEGLLVLEDFSETVSRGEAITSEQILEESQTLAAKSASGVLGALRVMPSALKNISWIEFLLALGTIFIIYGFKRITTAVPSTLVALVVMTGVAILFVPSYRPITAIPQGFPVPKWEIFTELSLGQLLPYVFTALTLSLLGAIDSLLTSVVADNMTKTRHKPNKELIGQGIGNSISAMFGGIPGAGATIRTVVNINSGGKTRISGMFAGIVLLLILLLFSSAASTIPAAVLAGILVTVGIGVMDYKGLRAIPSLPRDLRIGKLGISSEVVVMLAVMLLSTFWNLVYAVGIGLVMASLMFMKKIGDLTESRSKVSSGSDEKLWEDETAYAELKSDKIAIKHINGPLFFGSTDGFSKLAKEISPSAKTVLFRFDRMEYIDQSGLYALEDLLVDLMKNTKTVYFIHLPSQPRYMMERIGLVPRLVPAANIFEELHDFLLHIKTLNIN